MVKSKPNKQSGRGKAAPATMDEDFTPSRAATLDHRPPPVQTSVLPTTGSRFQDDPVTERFIELLDRYGSERETRALLLAILEAKAAPEDAQAQYLAISFHLAELHANPFTPDMLSDAIGEATNGVANEVTMGVDSVPVLRAGGFVPVLEAFKKSEGKGDGQ